MSNRRWFQSGLHWLLPLVAASFAFLAVWCLVAESSYADSSTPSAKNGSYFFRLTAKYIHGGEHVDFDIVVGCAVRVTAYGNDSESYDAFRDPIFFVVPTLDGGAVMQIVPNACRGETSENGDVPKDFLPGAIWFESKKDMTLGIAYVSEEAFAQTNAKLKFLGAAIHSASRADWEAFRPTAAQNLLSPKPFIYGKDPPSDPEIAAHLWDREKLASWMPRLSCMGYRQFQLTDPAAREILSQYWSSSRPRFWAPAQTRFGEILSRLSFNNKLQVNGHKMREYFSIYEQGGFPTTARGGMLRSGHPWSHLPPTFYPLRADDGLPWLREQITSATTIYRDVDVQHGASAGVACTRFG